MKYFDDIEFVRATPSCRLSDMDSEFIELVSRARELAGVPFVVSSAYRPKWYELKKGRSGSSFHVFGRALDVICRDSKNRAIIVKACLACGLTCGVHKDFIHIDNRSSQILFLY